MTEGQNDSSAADLTRRQERSRRARNIAIGLTLGFLVLLFYAMTIVRLGPNVFNRPI